MLMAFAMSNGDNADGGSDSLTSDEVAVMICEAAMLFLPCSRTRRGMIFVEPMAEKFDTTHPCMGNDSGSINEASRTEL